MYLQVKLVKVEDDDLDVDVDVDLSDEDNSFEQNNVKSKEQREQLNKDDISSSQEDCKSSLKKNVFSTTSVDFLKLDEETLKLINSTEMPKYEMILAPHCISHLEKVINWDYFEGGISKSPPRYLKVNI